MQIFKPTAELLDYKRDTFFSAKKNVKLAEVATTVKSQLLQKQPACLMVIIANSLWFK